MIFSFFLRKNQKDPQPFPTTVAVQKFIKSYIEPDDWVIALPGYMSETEKNIDDYVDQIFCSGLSQPISNAYFAEGVNGTHNVKKSTVSPVQTIQAWHNSKFKTACPWSIPNQRDHAKMMIFTDGGPTSDGIANVKAILLGSSNQSKQTYFSRIADKGEADIFLIDGKYLCPKTTEGKINDNMEIKEAEKLYRNIQKHYEHDNEHEHGPLIALFQELSKSQDLLNKIFKEVLRP